MQNAQSILMRIRNEMAVPVRRDLTTATLNQWVEILAKLETRLEPFTEEEKKIHADRFLSDTGKGDKLVQAGMKTITGLTWLARVLETLDRSIADYRRTYFAVPASKADPVLTFLQEKEVRENLAALNPAQKSLAYVLASECDDELTMRAIVQAPGQPWVAGETKEKADAARAQRLDPTGYAKHLQAKRLRELVASVREHLCVWALYLGVSQATLVAVFGHMDTGLTIGTPATATHETGEDVRQALAKVG